MRAPLVVLAVALAAGCIDTGAPPATTPDAAPAPPAWSWASHAAGPTPRTEVAVAATDSAFHVIGGFTEDGSAVGTVGIYDAAADAWTAGPDYPHGVHHMAAAAVDGAVFVFGGWIGAPGAGAAVPVPAPSALAFKLEPGASAWTPIRPLPVPRAAHAAAVVDGKVYLVGGLGANLELTNAVDVYDVASDAWSTVADLPTGRDHLAAAGVAGKVYVAAGQLGSHDAPVDPLEVFDPATGEWATMAPVPVLRNSLAAVDLGGKLLVAGGQDGARTFADAETFDPATGAWTTLPLMPTARHGFGMGVFAGRAFALMGGPEPGLSVTGAVESLGPGA